MSDVETLLEWIDFVWPDDTATDRLRLKIQRLQAGGWRGVGVITSMDSRRMYALFEREKKEEETK